jgi:hypothetical protein
MRRRKSVTVCGFTVIALSAVIIGDVIAVPALDRGRPATVAAQPKLLATPTLQPAATTTATPRPTPTPSAPKANAAALERFEKSWSGVVRISVSAIRAHDAAGEYLSGGDTTAAAGELKSCQDIASGIASESVKLPLETVRHSDSNLLAAIKKVGDGLGYGCKSARAYLDTGNPADFADSRTRFAHVADEIVRSESLARVIYLRLGGNPDDLFSFKTALR